MFTDVIFRSYLPNRDWLMEHVRSANMGVWVFAPTWMQSQAMHTLRPTRRQYLPVLLALSICADGFAAVDFIAQCKNTSVYLSIASSLHWAWCCVFGLCYVHCWVLLDENVIFLFFLLWLMNLGQSEKRIFKDCITRRKYSVFTSFTFNFKQISIKQWSTLLHVKAFLLLQYEEMHYTC